MTSTRRATRVVSDLALLTIVFTTVVACNGNESPTSEPPKNAETSNTRPAEVPQTDTPVPKVNRVDENIYFATSGGVSGYFFVTPSGLWKCAIIPGGSSPQAGCQPETNTGAGINVAGAPTVIDRFSGQNVPPNAVLVDRAGGPRFERLGQAIFWLEPGPAAVLQYGALLSAGGFTCNTQTTGVSCKVDDTGDGFTFSTNGYAMSYTDLGTTDPPAPAATTTSSTGFECGPADTPWRDRWHINVVVDSGPATCAEAKAPLVEFGNGRAWVNHGPFNWEDGIWTCVQQDVRTTQLGTDFISCRRADGSAFRAIPVATSR